MKTAQPACAGIYCALDNGRLMAASPRPLETRPCTSDPVLLSSNTSTKSNDQTPWRPFFGDQFKLPPADIAGVAAGQYEVVSQKVSDRLAQRPGSYVVLKYVRPVVRRRDAAALLCAPAPAGVIEGSRADVSFIAGMMVDKLVYHLPLYRQPQRLAAAGFKLSRQWLTHLMQSATELLAPIHEAQRTAVLASRVKAMDETPIKAGRVAPGKMKAAHFWPIYGANDEICFLYYPDRSARNVHEALGLKPPDGAVLLTDGYAAYAQYARTVELTHAQCWAHARRAFIEASQIEPQRAEQALAMIAESYAIEADVRARGFTGDDVRIEQERRAGPKVAALLRWVDGQFERQGLQPGSALTKALADVRERREGLQVYLHDPQVAIDTNHLERALRAIPMGRRNWLFCWTKLGAQHVGMMQSLLVTCRLHGVDPYEYRVDVLQRVSQHPARQVEELTPRRWKQRYAAAPLRSPLHDRIGPIKYGA